MRGGGGARTEGDRHLEDLVRAADVRRPDALCVTVVRTSQPLSYGLKLVSCVSGDYS